MKSPMIHPLYKGSRRQLRALEAALLGAALLALLLCTGCESPVRTAGRAIISGESKAVREFVGDPVALTTVRTILVLPFDDQSGAEGFDAERFGTLLANQLASTGTVRVLYPRQAMERVKEENKQIYLHNSNVARRANLGIHGDQERMQKIARDRAALRDTVAGEEDVRKPPMDPMRNDEDAIKLGRMLKADAVVVGVVSDYDPYMRPRLSLQMRILATGTSEGAAVELAELTQWGIPRRLGAFQGGQVIWFIQQNFDSTSGNIGRNIYKHALLKHTEHHPYDTEIYLRSMDKYSEFVCATLAASVLEARNDAFKEAEQRALAEAKKHKEDTKQVKAKLMQLAYPNPTLPDADKMMETNLTDRRSTEWQPDVYNRAHPDKAARAYR